MVSIIDGAAPDIDPEDTYAYVFPDRQYEIFLCNLFWQTSLTGTDSKAGTIIHELSHFYVVARTTDHGNIYGQADCRQLAIDDPDKAILHVDSHEYFAKIIPYFKCNLFLDDNCSRFL